MLDAKNRNIDYLSQQNWCANNLSTCTYQWGLGPAATYKVRNKMNMFEFGKKNTKIGLSDHALIKWHLGNVFETFSFAHALKARGMTGQICRGGSQMSAVGDRCEVMWIMVNRQETWRADVDHTFDFLPACNCLIACSRAYLWRLHQQQWNSTSESRHQICFICHLPAIHQPNQGKLRHILTKSNMDEASPLVCFVRSTLWWLRGHEDLRTFSVKKNVVTISKLQRRLKQIQHPKQHCANGKEHKRNCYHHHKDLFCALEIVNWSLEFWIDFVCWPQFDLFRVGFQPQNQLVFHSISCLGIVGNTSREQKICMANRCWFAFCC